MGSGGMKRYWLIVKVSVVNILQRLHILPMVWYQCQIDLGKLEGIRLYKSLFEHEDEWK